MKHSRKSAQKKYRHSLLAALSQILKAPSAPNPDPSDPVAKRSPRRWQPMLLVWTALLMAWDGGASLAEQFDAAKAAVIQMFYSLKRPGKTYQGFVKAMAVRGAMLLDRLCAHLRQHVRSMESCWTVEGINAFAADGSRVECPRTAANQAHLKCAGREKTGPQLSLTTLYHMGSGCMWDYRVGPGIEDETVHLRSMLATLPPGATIVADAGFIGYQLLRDILGSGRHILFRVGSNVTLLRKLGYVQVEDDSRVYLWPGKAQKARQQPIALRLIVVQGQHPVYLVTDLAPEALSFEQAAVLYRLRWGIEVFYRGLKQTLKHRKMRSRAPSQAAMELKWAVAALWVLSVRGAQELVARGKNPRSLSIALARKLFRQAMAQRCRRGADLGRQLGAAVKDEYVRHGAKASRDWPRKKKQCPPGAPKIQVAGPKQLLRIQELLKNNQAA